MLVPVFHFFEDVSLVFFEFAEGVRFDLLDFVTLALKFCVELLDKLTLLFLTLFLLVLNRFLNLGTFFSKILENFTLFLHTSILFSLQVTEVLVHLSVDGSQLIVQALNSITSLLGKHILKVSHAIATPLMFTLLVFVLSVELILHFIVKFIQLLIISDLVGLQRIVNLLSFIHSILLDVLDFSIEERQ